MPANEYALPELPDDFQERCIATYKQLEAGEPMTVEYIAEQLGMPFEFFAAACAIYSAVVYGVPVEIDASSRQTTH
jgi:hypothetical protein